MALTKIEGLRTPLDGTEFRTEANLNSLLRAASHYNDDMTWPSVCDETRVPVYVRMEKYKAQETRETPDGMIFGPVVRIGSRSSPECALFGYHHAAGLTKDYHLDGSYAVNTWFYHPIEGDVFPPGEDASCYKCDTCNETLYRDDDSRRSHRSACIYDGGLVCRDCDARGLVADGETQDQMERARHLADYIGDDCRANLDKHIERLGLGFFFGKPSQTRLYREDRFNFAWATIAFTAEGKKRGMNGGLIKHGPTAIEDGAKYKFRVWDYGAKAERDATHDEIRGTRWSVHT